MEKEILSEIRELKSLLAKLVGTSDLPPEQQFSIEALDKAAREFELLSIQRGDWVKEDDISKFIKSAPWRAGPFIREEFGFSNYFKRGHYYFYSKKDLIALGKELEARKVNLARYVELREDQRKFEKYMEAILQNKPGKGKKKPYKLPPHLRDIQTTPPKMPDPEVIRTDLKNLKAEFFRQKYAAYVDIYQGNHAMLKNIYWYQKYIDPQVRRNVTKWCESFNLVNRLLKELTKKKEVFIPVKEEEMIQL